VSAATATLILGDAADMACVGTGDAHLVLTSPPYFPDDMVSELAESRRKQIDPDAAWRRLEAFGRSLKDVFREMSRVVGRVGLCCIETKDIAYGDFRLPLAALHGALARDAGLWVRSSLQFRATGVKPAHLPSCVSRPRPGSFRTLDVSTVLICGSARWTPRDLPALAMSRPAMLEMIHPYWRLTPARTARIHEHQSPPSLVRRLIELLTVPGDLVVDPFAGSAQTLRIARDLGRMAIGYEKDPERHALASAAMVDVRRPKRGRSRARTGSRA
jgi:hypothetical protein